MKNNEEKLVPVMTNAEQGYQQGYMDGYQDAEEIWMQKIEEILKILGQ
jgi:hypothetical protein